MKLTFHIGYYVREVLEVLQGETLKAHDSLSFAHPSIASEQEWQSFLAETFATAERFAASIEELPGHKLDEDFTEAKYGSYYRNLQGIIEHTHYHLGQIVLIKKLLNESSPG